MCFCIAFTILQYTITRDHHFDGELHVAVQKLNRKGYISTLCYAISIPAALFDTRISCVLFLLVSVMWMIPERSIERALNK